MVVSALAKEFDDTAAAVLASKVSNSKWKPVDRLIAEHLGLDPDDVYSATVSKSGNLDVRFGQSPRARRAPIAVAMFDDDEQVELGRIAESAGRHLKSNAPRDIVLVFMQTAGGWMMAALFHRAGSAPPATLLSAWPAAMVISV